MYDCTLQHLEPTNALCFACACYCFMKFNINSFNLRQKLNKVFHHFDACLKLDLTKCLM